MSFPRKQIENHMNLMWAGVKEHYFESFQELAQQDPLKAIQEFKKYLNGALSSGNNFFRGMNCGGPMPEVTTPFLNAIGSIYPQLNKGTRKKALGQVLSCLDGLNYENSQNNVAWIDEPWLVGDILINRWIYWPGFQEHINFLKDKAIWEDISPEILTETGNLNLPSHFWFAYTLATKNYGNPAIRERFSELFPEIMDRTLDAIAANTAYYSANFALNPRVNKEEIVPYKIGVEKKVNNFAPELHSPIRSKINEKKWIIFPTDLVSETFISFLEGEESIV